jgi:PAS domain S-box-containing protein
LFQDCGQELHFQPFWSVLLFHHYSMTTNPLACERIDEKLRESLAFLETLFDSIPAAVVVSDESGCIVRVSAQVERMFGYGSAELLGQTIEILVPERFRSLYVQHRQHYRLDPQGRGMRAGVELYGRHKAGEEFPIDATVTLCETQQGKRILSFIRDLTDRDSAVGFRLDFAALVNSSGEAIIGKTLDGIITSWNRSAERIFGYSVGEAIGKPISMLFPAGQEMEAADALDRLNRGETISTHDAVRVRKDGRNIDVSVTISPVFDPLGNLLGASNVARDVTELKQMKTELEIRRAQAVLSARLSELGMMAGSIAHEINNPLAVIHATASDLLEMAEAGDVPLEAVEVAGARIKRTANRISKIVKSLRQIARKGTSDPFQRASAAQIVEEVLDLCKERFRAHSVRVDAPTVDPGIEVLCREVQISQVLLNLLQNGFDAVVDSEADKWVQLEVTCVGQSVVFAVIDSGAGIAPDIAAQIMEPFFTTKPLGKGTGLGLSLSKAIVEEHGGELTLGARGNHTCFSFLLPRFKEPENVPPECNDTRG